MHPKLKLNCVINFELHCKMYDNLIKPKSVKDFKVGDTVTTIGGKYANLTAKVVKVGSSYITFLHPITKKENRTWWSSCYIHPPKNDKGASKTTSSSETQVDVLLELLTGKLDDCSITKHIECVEIIKESLNKRKNSISEKSS